MKYDLNKCSTLAFKIIISRPRNNTLPPLPLTTTWISHTINWASFRVKVLHETLKQNKTKQYKSYHASVLLCECWASNEKQMFNLHTTEKQSQNTLITDFPWSQTTQNFLKIRTTHAQKQGKKKRKREVNALKFIIT